MQLLRLAKGTLTYGLGLMLNRMVSFLLLPLFTRYLTPEDYGVSALIGLLMVAMSGVFSLGTGNSMGICYFEETDRSARPAIVWTTAVLLAVNATVLVLVLWSFAPPITKILFQKVRYADILRIAVLALGLQTILEPFWAYLRLEEKAKTFVAFSFLGTALTLGLSVYLIVFLGRGVRGLFEANLGSQLIILPVLIRYGWRHLPWRLEGRRVRPLVRIGFPSIFGLGAFLLIDYADRLILQRMLGLEQVGIYTIGYNFGMILLLAVGAFGNAWPPYFASFINKRQEAEQLFGKVLKYYLAVFGFFSLLLFVAARPLVELMTAPAFHGAYSVVGLVGLAYMLKGCYLILLPGIFFAKKLYLQAIIEWIAAILNIALNLVLIPWLGKEGAAWATCLAYLALPVGAYLVSRQYLAVAYERRQLAWIIGALGAGVLVLMRMNAMASLATQTWMGAVCLMAFGVVALFAGSDRSERNQVWQMLTGGMRTGN